MLCCCWSPRCSGAREAWMSNSAARPREDDSCLVSPIAPASAVAPCLVMPATSCPARVRDEDQLAVGALLPAVHGRFTSSRSYRSPDRSSSYRVALIIWRAALPLRRRVSTACGRGSSTASSLRNGDGQTRASTAPDPCRPEPSGTMPSSHQRAAMTTWPRTQSHRQRGAPRGPMRHVLARTSRRLSVRASSSALPLLRLPTVLFPSQPLSLRLTQSDADGTGGDPLPFEAPDMAAPAELVSCA